MNKNTAPKSFRLTEDAEWLIEGLSMKLGVNNTGIMELAIRQMAEREGVKMATITSVGFSVGAIATGIMRHLQAGCTLVRVSTEALDDAEGVGPGDAESRAKMIARDLELSYGHDAKLDAWWFKGDAKLMASDSNSHKIRAALYWAYKSLVEGREDVGKFRSVATANVSEQKVKGNQTGYEIPIQRRDGTFYPIFLSTADVEELTDKRLASMIKEDVLEISNSL